MACLAGAFPSQFTAQTRSLFAGRWDLTITAHGEKASFPSWLEFADERGLPVVRIVGRAGSVHAVNNAHLAKSHLIFSDPQSQHAGPWNLIVKNGQLSGHSPDGEVAGLRAPLLDRQAPPAWSVPQSLFNGRDLSGWTPSPVEKNNWVAQDGELRNQAAGANLRTLRSFGDFKLHVEYNCPTGGNSGVYLRGRYEVQVEYEPPAKNDAFHSMGSIYGFIPPAAEVPGRPGQWESYDVTLVGRTVTVVRDGVLIIDRAEVPGITGGALDSREGQPGPIYLQGDHTGGLRYRNITIASPAQP
jgi:hypothetical protein